MKRRFTRVLKFILFAVLAVSVFSFVVMSLWNWLMPPIFGLQAITFGQALGLLVLSKILFSGFRGRPGGPGMHWRRRVTERWEQMTPEERARFRQGFRDRSGRTTPLDSNPTA